MTAWKTSLETFPAHTDWNLVTARHDVYIESYTGKGKPIICSLNLFGVNINCHTEGDCCIERNTNKICVFQYTRIVFCVNTSIAASFFCLIQTNYNCIFNAVERRGCIILYL